MLLLKALQMASHYSLNPNSTFCDPGMDWPLFVSMAAPRDGNEIDGKEPVGTVTGCKVSLMAKGVRTEADHA